MWAEIPNKPKQGTIFRKFRGELINSEVDVGENVEGENMSDRIEGVISEEANDFNKVR